MRNKFMAIVMALLLGGTAMAVAPQPAEAHRRGGAVAGAIIGGLVLGALAAGAHRHYYRPYRYGYYPRHYYRPYRTYYYGGFYAPRHRYYHRHWRRW